MTTVNMLEAKTSLSKLVEAVESGAETEIIIARNGKPALNRVIAIGDSVRTDLKGAVAYGMDCLFVTAGIHAEELGQRHDPNLTALNKIFADAGVAPRAVTRRLMW